MHSYSLAELPKVMHSYAMRTNKFAIKRLTPISHKSGKRKYCRHEKPNRQRSASRKRNATGG